MISGGKANFSVSKAECNCIELLELSRKTFTLFIPSLVYIFRLYILKRSSHERRL